MYSVQYHNPFVSHVLHTINLPGSGANTYEYECCIETMEHIFLTPKGSALNLEKALARFERNLPSHGKSADEGCQASELRRGFYATISAIQLRPECINVLCACDNLAPSRPRS